VSVTIAPERLKDATRMIYRRLARAHSTNLSEAPVPSGETLARTLGYDPDGLPLPTAAWELFAGCGNPHEFLALQPEWRVLDIGCGAGIDTQIAALRLRAPGLAIGLDYTRELLHLARAYTASHLRNRCIWLAGDGEDLPLRAESIHVAFANGSFNLMPRKERVLREVRRALVSGGRLIVADLVRIGVVGPFGEGYEDAWAWCVAGALAPDEYDPLLAGAGFSRWELRLATEYGPLAGAVLVAYKG
jgi:SAM-dependent methyltransferase